ncbi:hypothetical protein [Viridibacillus arvi]|uniref:hypothetical protein n=1 Tax=Viridibacillus arvi TaxID=263475 RepID=UPI0034CDD677
MEQMSIFNIDVPSTEKMLSVCESNHVQKQDALLTKWRMFEYLDQLKGQTALVSYSDETVEFHVPFQFGEIHFSGNAISSRPANIVRLRSFVSANSEMQIKHNEKSGILTRLERKEQSYLMHYLKEVNNEIQEKCSSATFELRSYSISKMPHKQPSYSYELPLSQLVGLTAKVMMRCEDDLVDTVESMPFKILSIKVENEKIVIMGTNDVCIKVDGFQKVRKSNDLIFDVCNNHRYSQSFHLAID